MKTDVGMLSRTSPTSSEVRELATGMSSELIQLLEKEAEAERERILREARQQAGEILAKAQEEATRLRSEHQKRLEEELAVSRVKARSTATLQATALLLQAKDRALEEAFRQAQWEIHRLLTDREIYKNVLRSLIQEGVPDFSGHLVIEVAREDTDLARSVIAEMGLDAEVRADDQIKDGVRILSGGGRFVVENTLASRLERAKPLLTAEVARILWG